MKKLLLNLICLSIMNDQVHQNLFEQLLDMFDMKNEVC
jgi:hypothetical protein